ncbi:MAG: hypothetical protein V4671_01680 [Armatimonadota bacterium]
MYFKRESPKADAKDTASADTFWLRNEKDQVISFRDQDAAEHFLKMVESSEAYIRLLPSVQPAVLQAYLCEYDNNGYVIQLTLSLKMRSDSGIIPLSRSNSQG